MATWMVAPAAKLHLHGCVEGGNASVAKLYLQGPMVMCLETKTVQHTSLPLHGCCANAQVTMEG